MIVPCLISAYLLGLAMGIYVSRPKTPAEARKLYDELVAAENARHERAMRGDDE